MYDVNTALHYRSYPIAIVSNTNNNTLAFFFFYEIIIAAIVPMTILLLSFLFFPFAIKNMQY